MNCYRCNPDQDVEHCQWPGRFLDSFPSQLLDPPLLSSGHASECLSRIGLVCSWTLCEWNHTVWGIFIWLLLTSSFQCEPCDSSVMLQLVPLHCCVVFHHMDVSIYIYIFFFFFFSVAGLLSCFQILRDSEKNCWTLLPSLGGHKHSFL